MTKRLTVYVAADTTARSVGADAVARAIDMIIARLPVEGRLLRPGSRGLYWLEPMVEVDTDKGRIAFGPLSTDDVDSIFSDTGEPHVQHAKYLGLTEEIKQLAVQSRLTFQRVGLIEPLSLDDYCENGGYAGLTRALTLTPLDIVETVKESGLRGRGGAAFPTGIKWQTVLNAEGERKYIVCNADEGDSGTYADRMIMESDPFVLIEGMTIAAIATGATQGYIYTRAEYPQAIDTLNDAIAIAQDKGYLGDDIQAAANDLSLKFARRPGPTFAAKKLRYLRVWRAGAGW